jgi:hypothetical protein
MRKYIVLDNLLKLFYLKRNLYKGVRREENDVKGIIFKKIDPLTIKIYINSI